MAIQPDTVGVRELRQNLSVYLKRVAAGETLRVTEQGRPVAMLTPLPKQEESVLDRLIAQGLATPAKEDLVAYLEREGLPRPHPTRMSISKALEEERAERL
jgi:prevent-host-death family protein